MTMSKNIASFYRKKIVTKKFSLSNAEFLDSRASEFLGTWAKKQERKIANSTNKLHFTFIYQYHAWKSRGSHGSTCSPPQTLMSGFVQKFILLLNSAAGCLFWIRNLLIAVPTSLVWTIMFCVCHTTPTQNSSVCSLLSGWAATISVDCLVTRSH